MNFKKIIPRDILVILILASVLNILRVVIFGSHSFVWLFWNIFLAIIPFSISTILIWLDKKEKLNKTIFIIGGIVWLLFIPNAPYLVTDFIHIGVVRSVPALYDTFLIFSFAWAGLYLGLYSISHIDEIIRKRYSNLTCEIIIPIIMLLIGFGVYLGRALRFNSWDVFVNHTSLLNHLWKIISQATIHTEVYFYTILISVFLYLFYKSFKYSKIK
jgi:uncharacterized membrane protein